MSKLVWCLKQLFPLTYWGVYKEVSHQINGIVDKTEGPMAVYKIYFTIWHMWFGKTYDIMTFEVNDYENGTKKQLVILDGMKNYPQS